MMAAPSQRNNVILRRRTGCRMLADHQDAAMRTAPVRWHWRFMLNIERVMLQSTAFTTFPANRLGVFLAPFRGHSGVLFTIFIIPFSAGLDTALGVFSSPLSAIHSRSSGVLSSPLSFIFA